MLGSERRRAAAWPVGVVVRGLEGEPIIPERWAVRGERNQLFWDSSVQ